MKIKNIKILILSLLVSSLFNGCTQLKPTPATTFIDLYILNKTVTRVVEVKVTYKQGQLCFKQLPAFSTLHQYLPSSQDTDLMIDVIDQQGQAHRTHMDFVIEKGTVGQLQLEIDLTLEVMASGNFSMQSK